MVIYIVYITYIWLFIYHGVCILSCTLGLTFRSKSPVSRYNFFWSNRGTMRFLAFFVVYCGLKFEKYKSHTLVNKTVLGNSKTKMYVVPLRISSFGNEQATRPSSVQYRTINVRTRILVKLISFLSSPALDISCMHGRHLFPSSFVYPSLSEGI